MPQFDTDLEGRSFGFDSLEYVDLPSGKALRVRPMGFWQAVVWAGLRVALRPRAARPWMARERGSGWVPLRERVSQTGRVSIEYPGRVSFADLQHIKAETARQGGWVLT